MGQRLPRLVPEGAAALGGGGVHRVQHWGAGPGRQFPARPPVHVQQPLLAQFVQVEFRYVPRHDYGRNVAQKQIATHMVLLTDTQSAYDGVSDHADVAFYFVGVLASGSAMAPSREADDRMQRRLPRRFRSSTLRACGAGGLPSNRSLSEGFTAVGVPPHVCTRMSSRLQKLSTVPLHELDAVMFTDVGGPQVSGAMTPGQQIAIRIDQTLTPGPGNFRTTTLTVT